MWLLSIVLFNDVLADQDPLYDTSLDEVLPQIPIDRIIWVGNSFQSGLAPLVVASICGYGCIAF